MLVLLRCLVFQQVSYIPACREQQRASAEWFEGYPLLDALQKGSNSHVAVTGRCC